MTFFDSCRQCQVTRSAFKLDRYVFDTKSIMQIVLSLIDQRIIDLPSGLIGRLFAVESIEQTKRRRVRIRATNLNAIRIGITWARNSCNLYQRLADDY